MHDTSHSRAAASLAIIAATIFVGACAALAPVVERSAERAADAVEAYCDNFTTDQRSAFRANVNGRLAEGYGAEIHCPSD